jgi:hypothetical protein
MNVEQKTAMILLFIVIGLIMKIIKKKLNK